MANLTERTQFFETSGVYTLAVALRQPFMDVLSEGAVRPYDALVVPKSGTVANPDAGGGARNMTVDVLGADAGGPAAVWVLGDTTPGTEGIYRQRLDAARYNLAVTSNASGSVRVDNVNLRIDAAGQQGVLEVQAGTPGSGAPTASASTVTLAQVTVASGATSIVGSNIADTRTFVRGGSVITNPSGGVSLTANSWTDILTRTIILPRDARLKFKCRARYVNSGVGNPFVDLAVIEGSTLIERHGSEDIFGTGSAAGTTRVLKFDCEKDFTAGSHTFKMQGYKDANGSIDVTMGNNALQGYSSYVTRLLIEVV